MSCDGKKAHELFVKIVAEMTCQVSSSKGHR